MNYEVFDDFLSEENFEKFAVMLSMDFPWFYSDVIVNGAKGELDRHDFQLVHYFYKDYGFNSHFSHLVAPLLAKLNPYAIINIKAKLIGSTSERLLHGYHVDINKPTPDTRTAVFYINSNNGVTLLGHGSGLVKVESVANRLLVFDTRTEHAGSTCTDQKTRVLINFNYITKPETKNG